MTAYVDYAYYIGTFHGSAVNEAAFPRLALMASYYIEAVTHGKAVDTIEAVKDATCAAAEMMQQINIENSGTIKASESVADWSASYVKSQDMSVDKNIRLMNAIEPYFYGTGLLYAGIDYPTIADVLGAIT